MIRRAFRKAKIGKSFTERVFSDFGKKVMNKLSTGYEQVINNLPNTKTLTQRPL